MKPLLYQSKDLRYVMTMRKMLILVGMWCSAYSLIPSQALAGVEPHPPVSASWGMTLEQVQRLPELEHATDGTLQNSYSIRGTSQIELVARWKGRTVSFYVAHDIGLYAINFEMTPQRIQHAQTTTDPELLDLEQCAPIRLAIMRKYGTPTGLAVTWDTNEISPFSSGRNFSTVTIETASTEWPYARNLVLWEGQETRLALGEESVWYVSRLGLIRRERAKQELEKARELSFARELERRAKRQQQIEEAREAVPSRAEAVTALF